MPSMESWLHPKMDNTLLTPLFCILLASQLYRIQMKTVCCSTHFFLPQPIFLLFLPQRKWVQHCPDQQHQLASPKILLKTLQQFWTLKALLWVNLTLYAKIKTKLKHFCTLSAIQHDANEQKWTRVLPVCLAAFPNCCLVLCHMMTESGEVKCLQQKRSQDRKRKRERELNTKCRHCKTKRKKKRKR